MLLLKLKIWEVYVSCMHDCKKRIVILTSELLFEFLLSEHSEPSCCVRVAGEFIKNVEHTLAHVANVFSHS